MSNKYLTIVLSSTKSIEFFKYDDGDIEIDIPNCDKFILDRESVDKLINWIQEIDSECPQCGSELIHVDNTVRCTKCNYRNFY